MNAMGHRVWAIPEGWIPGRSTGPDDMDRTLHQHTRLDSRQAANALLTTLAFPVPDAQV